jgi:hypothetical protein
MRNQFLVSIIDVRVFILHWILGLQFGITRNWFIGSVLQVETSLEVWGGCSEAN